jgi:AcrR family transcriptional regulator
MDGPAAERPKRALRSDAARNRVALLDAAKTLFAAGGSGVTLESVARAAGLGVGTLYRHFPTREALYEAVYARDIDAMVTLGAALRNVDDPLAALRRWLHAAIDMVATKKGMIAALAIGVDTRSAISQRATGRLIAALDPLLARAVAAGRLRDELSAEELFLAVIGMAILRDQSGWRDSVERLIDTLLKGLARD